MRIDVILSSDVFVKSLKALRALTKIAGKASKARLHFILENNYLTLALELDNNQFAVTKVKAYNPHGLEYYCYVERPIDTHNKASQLFVEVEKYAKGSKSGLTALRVDPQNKQLYLHIDDLEVDQDSLNVPATYYMSDFTSFTKGVKNAPSIIDMFQHTIEVTQDVPLNPLRTESDIKPALRANEIKYTTNEEIKLIWGLFSARNTKPKAAKLGILKSKPVNQTSPIPTIYKTVSDEYDTGIDRYNQSNVVWYSVETAEAKYRTLEMPSSIANLFVFKGEFGRALKFVRTIGENFCQITVKVPQSEDTVGSLTVALSSFEYGCCEWKLGCTCDVPDKAQQYFFDVGGVTYISFYLHIDTALSLLQSYNDVNQVCISVFDRVNPVYASINPAKVSGSAYEVEYRHHFIESCVLMYWASAPLTLVKGDYVRNMFVRTGKGVNIEAIKTVLKKPLYGTGSLDATNIAQEIVRLVDKTDVFPLTLLPIMERLKEFSAFSHTPQENTDFVLWVKSEFERLGEL